MLCFFSFLKKKKVPLEWEICFPDSSQVQNLSWSYELLNTDVYYENPGKYMQM